MSLQLSNNPKEDFVEYDKRFKKWYGLSLIFLGSLFALTIIFYFVVLRRMYILEGTVILSIFTHIKNNVANVTLLGFFYVFLFGGIFFIFVPVEVAFIAVLRAGKFSPFYLMVMFLGILCSYSFNYLVGLRFARIAKRLVAPKKFYSTRKLVNKLGKIAILILNLIGFGSQQLTFVLGVFRYNKTRLMLFTLVGQIIRFTVVAVITLNIMG